MTQHQSPEDRRRQILDAARSRFITEGYGSARMQDIARDAKLSKGGVYFHFRSKRELFDALLNEEFEESMAFLREVSDDSEDYTRKLTRLATHFVLLFSQRSELARFRIVMGEMAMRDPEVKTQLQRLNRVYIDEVSALLERGVTAGVLRSDLNVRVTATLLKALLDGIQESLALDPVEGPELVQLLRGGIEMMMQGITNPDLSLDAPLPLSV